MLSQHLLEVLACPEKPVKGPPPNTPPKQANPIELKRVLSAISTRRKNLDGAHQKLKQLASAGTNTTAYACQQLKVQAAHQWLDFTVKRWRLLSEFSKKHGKQTPDTGKLLSFGDVQATNAEKHLSVAHTDDEKPHTVDVSFDHEKGHLVDPSGNPFEIPDDPNAQFVFPKKAEPTPPPPEAPSPHVDEPTETPPKTASSSSATASGAQAAPTDAGHPDDDQTTPQGDHPWKYDDYIASEKNTINNVAHAVSKIADGKTSGPGFDAALKSLKTQLAEIGKPLKHADAVKLLSDAVIGTHKGLSPDDKAHLEPKIKEHLLNYAAQNGYAGMSDADAAKFYSEAKGGAHADIDDMFAVHDVTNAVLKQLYEPLTPSEQASLATHTGAIIASTMDETTGQFNVPAAIEDLQKLTPQVVGKLLIGTAAADLVNSAIDNFKKKPKSISFYDTAEQQEIFAHAKDAAVQDAHAGLDFGDYKQHLAASLAKLSKPLTQSALDLISHENWIAHTHKLLTKLPPDTLDMVKSIAKQAVQDGVSVADAIQKSGVVHLDPEAIHQLKQDAEVELNPPAPGSLTPAEQSFVDMAFKHFHLLPPGVVPTKFDDIVQKLHQHANFLAYGIASKMGVEWPPNDAVKKAIEADALDYATGKPAPAAPESGSSNGPSLDALAASVVAIWDMLAAKGVPINAVVYMNTGKATVAEHLNGANFAELYGQFETDWLQALWEKWLAAHNAKTNVLSAPEGGDSEPKEPEIPGHGFLSTWTKNKKISDEKHLTWNQKSYLKAKFDAAIKAGTPLSAYALVAEAKLNAVAKKIHAEFKQDWAAAGVSGMNIGLVKSMLKKSVDAHQNAPPAAPAPTNPASSAAATSAAPASPSAAPPAPAAQPPAAQPDDLMALWHAMKAAGVPMHPFEENALPDIYKKTIAKGKSPTIKQQDAINLFIAKAKKLLPAAPGVPAVAKAPDPKTGAEEPEIAPTPALAVLKAAGVDPHDNPIGKTYEEIKKAADLDMPVGSPAPPGLDEGVWKGKSAFGGGGYHEKQFVGTDANFNVVGKTFKTGNKATHAWMFKGDKSAPFVAYGEVAAARTQSLLGIGATQHIWVEKDPSGYPGVMQHFAAQKSFRDLGEPEPWKTNPHKDKIAKQLQQSIISNHVLDDYDDHDGNFVIDAQGNVTPVDHGQAARFFDSSMTLTKKLSWEVPSPTASGFSAVNQDPGKGFPGRMLRAWAAGQDVPIAPLTDADFEATIARAEALPSDVYKEMWRPYAEGCVKKLGAVAGYSTVKKDQTVDGFLEGMDQRRKTIRGQVGDMYAHLTKTRAKTLKAQGDARPISEIEAEVRDQIGLDAFLKGKPVIASSDNKIVAKAVEKLTESPGWDFSKLPESSHVPHHEKLAKSGHMGIDMQVGGSHVKDGRAQFFQLGDNAFATLMLEPEARKRLEMRLPGGGKDAAPPKPDAPVIPPFKAPPKPVFKESTDDFHEAFLQSAGQTSDKYKTTADGTKVKVGKLEKHLDKLKKGEKSESANQYFQNAWDKAQDMSNSADAVEAAAGKHYVDQLAKLNADTTGTSFQLKNPEDVAAEDREIKPFKPSDAHIAKQKAAKADIEGTHKKAIEDAKTKWEENKAKAEAAYKEKLASWEKEKAKFDNEQAKLGLLPATMLDHYPVPANVELESAQGGQNKISTASKWAGAYDKPFDYHANPMKTYELDLTDAVTGVAAAGGATPPTKRLIVHYVPSPTSGNRPYPGRGGMMRIQFPSGSTQEQMSDYMQLINNKLSIDARPATEEDHELNYLRRMAWLRRLEGQGAGLSQTQEPSGSTKDKIEWWIGHFKKTPTKKHGFNEQGMGFDPRYEPERTAAGALKQSGGQPVYKKNADGSLKKNPSYQPLSTDIGGGRQAFRRFDITDEEMKNLGGSLTLYKKSHPQWLEQMINGGAVYSTEKRAHVGMMPYAPSSGEAVHGQSSDSDVKTGGSNEVYMFMKSGGASSLGWGHFDPRIMLYTSTWGHPTDSYGKKVNYNGYSGDVGSRAGSVQEDRMLAEMISHGDSSKEILVGDKVDFWKWIVRLNAPNQTTRESWIKKLKARGITHAGLDNKPIEEIIHAKSGYAYD